MLGFFFSFVLGFWFGFFKYFKNDGANFTGLKPCLKRKARDGVKGKLAVADEMKPVLTATRCVESMLVKKKQKNLVGPKRQPWGCPGEAKAVYLLACTAKALGFCFFFSFPGPGPEVWRRGRRLPSRRSCGRTRAVSCEAKAGLGRAGAVFGREAEVRASAAGGRGGREGRGRGSRTAAEGGEGGAEPPAGAGEANFGRQGVAALTGKEVCLLLEV